MQEACQCLVIPVTVCAHPSRKSSMDVTVQNGLWRAEQKRGSQLCVMQMSGSGITMKGSCHAYLYTYFYTYFYKYTDEL